MSAHTGTPYATSRASSTPGRYGSGSIWRSRSTRSFYSRHRHPPNACGLQVQHQCMRRATACQAPCDVSRTGDGGVAEAAGAGLQSGQRREADMSAGAAPQSLGVGRLLGRAWASYRARFGLYFGATAVAQLPTGLLTWLAGYGAAVSLDAVLAATLPEIHDPAEAI